MICVIIVRQRGWGSIPAALAIYVGVCHICSLGKDLNPSGRPAVMGTRWNELWYCVKDMGGIHRI